MFKKFVKDNKLSNRYFTQWAESSDLFFIFTIAVYLLDIIRDNEIIQLKGDRQPVSIHINEKEFTNKIFQLKKDDILYSFSDGYVDEFGGKDGKKFKPKNFQNLLLKIHKKTLPEQRKTLDKTITDWLEGYEQIDDILVIGMKI